MQFSNPTQSTRDRPRAALRLQVLTRHNGGWRFLMNLSARFIDFVCALTQCFCHWQLMPMLSATGSANGASAAAGEPTTANATNVVKASHLIDLSMPFLTANGNHG
jgi:hypothetical protein